MKKRIAIIIISVMFILSSISVSFAEQDFNAMPGFAIEFNFESAECSSVVLNNNHYVPVRKVFEKMGAKVFFRSYDNTVLALTRDGDIIKNVIGNNIIIVNGEEKAFETTSFIGNGNTYFPVEMLSAALCPDLVSYENGKLNIQKYLFNENYHKIVKDVLDESADVNFNPQNFQRYIKYHGNNPTMGIADAIMRVNVGLDYSFYDNVETIKDPYLLLVLVNKYNKLPEGFTQYNLVNMSREYTVNDGKQYLLAGSAYENYVKMADAAKKEGLSMKVVSAYRTEDYQRNLYNNKVRTTGKVNADNYSARPGFSEHQTGLAVDINSTKGSFEYTREFNWLQSHAHEYGYILRYPKGKEWITGYSYEPWHYRYVGEEAAGIIYEEKLTYEEFYSKYIASKEFR